MTRPAIISLRLIVMILLWVLPLAVYMILGLIALYREGWLPTIAWTLPILWLSAWMIGLFWPAPRLSTTSMSQPLTPREFWTPQDKEAITIVQQFRTSLPDIDRLSIADPARYFQDAQALSERLAAHYHPQSSSKVYQPLTIVEILSVIHLSVEDLETWIIENVPGSKMITIGQMEQLPTVLKAVDIGQNLIYLASAIVNPGKLLAYPLWRKAGRVTVEIQNELMRSFYQFYLRQVGFYLIEMYSGRLRGGSRVYRGRFGHTSAAVHTAGGDTEAFDKLEAVTTTIAVMGQVKAGKSSLVNALMKDKQAATSVLPETRRVERYEFRLPTTDSSVRSDDSPQMILLDTPGYSEADVSRAQQHEIESAVDLADIVLLVLSASSPAKQSDVQMLRALDEHYRRHKHLKPPPIIAVLTHIDQLRPSREWSPPYDWRQPQSTKEQSIADAAAYTQQLFGHSIAGIACVYTGEVHRDDASVFDEVIPLLAENVSQGHSAAILKAFYKQLSRKRFEQLSTQLINLVRQLIR